LYAYSCHIPFVKSPVPAHPCTSKSSGKNLISTGGGSRIDASLGVGDDFADDPSLLKVSEGLAGERAVDFQTIDQYGDGD